MYNVTFHFQNLQELACQFSEAQVSFYNIIAMVPFALCFPHQHAIALLKLKRLYNLVFSETAATNLRPDVAVSVKPACIADQTITVHGRSKSVQMQEAEIHGTISQR